MAVYLLDTNHLAPALRKVSPLRDWIFQACQKGNRFATCWPVLFELEAGIVNTKNPERNRRTLAVLMEKVAIWPQDWQVARRYGEVRRLLNKRGRVLSPVDITLLAFAIFHDAIVLTTDLDFSGHPDVRTENWVQS